MKWFLYNFLFAIAYVLMMPKFLLRMAKRGGASGFTPSPWARSPWPAS